MPKKKTNDWTKPLSNIAKAEILAQTIHVLTSHSPKVWAKVPAWLRSQIQQSMFDCSVDYRDMTKEDIRQCIEYGEWLTKKHPKRKDKPKHREPKIVNDIETRDFLYNKESSGR